MQRSLTAHLRAESEQSQIVQSETGVSRKQVSIETKQESASPLHRRELAPEGAATLKVLRSVNGPPPPNGGAYPMDTIVYCHMGKPR